MRERERGVKLLFMYSITISCMYTYALNYFGNRVNNIIKSLAK